LAIARRFLLAKRFLSPSLPLSREDPSYALGISPPSACYDDEKHAFMDGH
jgi:hypothetical protein